MWKLLYTVLLTVGTEYLAFCWIGCKRTDLLSHAISAFLCAAGYFAGSAIGPEYALPFAVFFAVMGLISAAAWKHRIRQAFSAAPLMILCAFLYVPFAGKHIWQYACVGCMILLILVYSGIYRFADRLEENWFCNLWDSDKRIYVSLALLPIAGAMLELALSALIDTDPMAAAIMEFFVFLIVIAAVLFIQRITCCYYMIHENHTIMEQWQQGARDYMNTIRSQRHDFNIHLHAIDGMIESGDFDECRVYVSKMVEDANEVNDIMPVYDAMIGSMLYNMRHLAQKLGTNIYYDIKYDMKHVICNAYECNRIIGNLIQNAMDAAITEEAKRHGIYVHIFKHSGSTVVSVSNYFDGDPNTILQAFAPNYSTKKHHEGIGLCMVEKTLKKYGGKVYAEFFDREITFIAHIPNAYLMEEKND